MFCFQERGGLNSPETAHRGRAAPCRPANPGRLGGCGCPGGRSDYTGQIKRRIGPDSKPRSDRLKLDMRVDLSAGATGAGVPDQGINGRLGNVLMRQCRANVVSQGMEVGITFRDALGRPVRFKPLGEVVAGRAGRRERQCGEQLHGPGVLERLAVVQQAQAHKFRMNGNALFAVAGFRTADFRIVASVAQRSTACA